MSIGNSAGISFGGLSSGLDTDSIVRQLVQLESIGAQRIQTQRQSLANKKGAYAEFRSQLQSLQSSVSSFSTPTAFETMKATASETASMDVSASVGAGIGVREVVIKTLATAHKIASAPQASASAAANLSGVFKVNGKDVTALATDSLTSIAQKINDVKSGVTATVVDGGTGQAYITLTSDKTGQSNGITLVDVTPLDPQSSNGGVAERLRLLQGSGPAITTLVPAADADYTVDGIPLRSASNTVTGVVPGVTMTFKAADPLKKVKLEVTQDLDSIVSNVKGFMQAYNRVNRFIRDNSKFDAETFQSGVLFGDSVATQAQGMLNNLMFNNVGDANAAYKNLTQLGFSLDEIGDLKMDESALKTALTANPVAVGNVFRSNGTSASNDLKFVFNSSKTKQSSTTGYEVTITQPATKTEVLAASGLFGNTNATETLTFTGTGFGTAGYSLVIPSNSSMNDIISLVNNDSRLKDSITASSEGGALKFTSKLFGVASDFNVVSDTPAGLDTTGIGTVGEATKTIGKDVAGTINGEPASGSGQYLLGNSTNANTSGLQVQYTGTSTGLIGSVKFNTGLGQQVLQSLDSLLNSTSGLISSSSNALDTQMTEMQERIDRISLRARERTQELKQKFARMEEAIARSQQQGQRLSSLRTQ